MAEYGKVYVEERRGGPVLNTVIIMTASYRISYIIPIFFVIIHPIITMYNSDLFERIIYAGSATNLTKECLLASDSQFIHWIITLGMAHINIVAIRVLGQRIGRL